MKRSLWIWTICCIFASPAFNFAQTASTSLRGVVRDPSGALVAGAKITLMDKANDKAVTAYANTAGSYVFPQIPPSTYSITAAAVGFADQTKTAELLVNQPATIDFTLTLKASQVTVDVSATAQTLNTTDATLGDSVGNSTIQALPMEGRDPIALLTLQPGVLYLGNPAENDTMDSRSGSVSGGRSDQGNITLDGMDDNDQINGTAFTGVLRSTLDSTEEFRVTTSNGTAASGRSSGAQVSLRHQDRNQRLSWRGVRVLSPHQHRIQSVVQQVHRALFGRAEHSPALRAEHLRRGRRRSSQKGQALLLRQL